MTDPHHAASPSAPPSSATSAASAAASATSAFAGAASATTAPRARRHWHGWGLGLAVVAGLLVLVLLVCEFLGWPFLRRPAERFLSEKLDRMVSFDSTGGGAWQLRLIGGLRLKTDSLQIAGPSWSTLGGPMLVAHDARLALRYGDLLAMRKGETLRVKSLQAGELQLRLERDVEGRASWQFGKQPDSDTQVRERPKVDGIAFDLLEVTKGSAIVDDKIQRLSLLARFALRESWEQDGAPSMAPGASVVMSDKPARPAARASAAASAPTAAIALERGASGPMNGVIAQAEGHIRDMPLQINLRTGSAVPWLSSDGKAPPVPVTLRGQLGRAKLSFDGEVRDLLVSQGLSGRYTVSGPSLAAVGEPLGVTLPTTPAFAMQGSLTREGPRWRTAIPKATIGKSTLSGEFEFNKPLNAIPKLTGELRGKELWLADLGPAVGVPADPEAPVASRATRVLPDKQFDLPSLRAMNADVNVNLDRFESGSALLQAAQPLKGRIVLQDGVLEVREIDARVARGQVGGRILLDGRQPQARWEVRLKIAGVKLEQWLKMERRGNQPPYVTGLMGGRVSLNGRGRSTAELLGSADGRMVLFWTQGTVSHLLVEAAGIDVAQALGVLITGDETLKVHCGIADLRVRQGRVTPQPMVIDTQDSLVNVEGDMSLATERLMLRARVQPKDMSPLTLRTPVKVEGTMADPAIGLEKTPLLKKLVPAVVLGAAVTPLAALVPLVDLGEEPDAESRAALEECNARLGGDKKPAKASP